MIETLRGTGRTTRMLEHARILAEEGGAVYVIADNERQAAQFKEMLPKGKGIKVELLSGLGNFDWATMTLQGAHPKCVVLMDHYAIERRHEALLEMLHRYDEERDLRTPKHS